MGLMIGQVPKADVGPVVGNGEEKKAAFGNWWMQWFNQSYAILFASQQSGTTANRPTKNLWIGRIYYDTSLGKPVWVNSVNPTVWHDGSGSVV